MQFALTITCLTALLTSTTVAQNPIQVENRCSFPIYFKLADSIDPFPPDVGTLGAGSIYSELFDRSGGRSIQLATAGDSFFGVGDVLTFEYTLSAGDVFYDLSTVDGNPFSGEAVEVTSSPAACPTVGIGPAYQQAGGEDKVSACTEQNFFTLALC